MQLDLKASDFATAAARSPSTINGGQGRRHRFEQRLTAAWSRCAPACDQRRRARRIPGRDREPDDIELASPRAPSVVIKCAHRLDRHEPGGDAGGGARSPTATSSVTISTTPSASASFPALYRACRPDRAGHRRSPTSRSSSRAGPPGPACRRAPSWPDARQGAELAGRHAAGPDRDPSGDEVDAGALKRCRARSHLMSPPRATPCQPLSRRPLRNGHAFARWQSLRSAALRHAADPKAAVQRGRQAVRVALHAAS